MTVAFRPLKQISNTETIKRRIDQASSRMFVREFCQNAIEAAKFAEFPRVKWWQFTEGGYRKLCVWNNGRGMDADELVEVMDLSASGKEKIQSVDENYGQGAKLTGLKANHAGVLWRSCKNGVVSQLLLGWENKVPGIIPQGDGEHSELVLDVSALYKDVMLSEFDNRSKGYSLFEMMGRDCPLLSFDWTLAVFLGKDIERQDTVADPWGNKDPGPGGADYWLINLINRRFYDLKGCNVTAINTMASPQSRRCDGLAHAPIHEANDETVLFDNYRIRYCILRQPKSNSSESAKGYGGHCALIYKNEVYDGLFGGDWGTRATRFGIFAGQNRISVQVILADNYPASPNEQRLAIERDLSFGTREQILLGEFEDVIEENLPQCVLDFIASQKGARQKRSEKVSQKIKQLMRDLQFRTVAPNADGDTPIGDNPTEGEAPAQPATDLRSKTGDSGENEGRGTRQGDAGDAGDAQPAKRKPSSNVFGRLGKPVATGVRRRINEEPDYEWVEGEDDGTIGHFDEKHNTLYLRRCHPVLSDTCKTAMTDYGIQPGLAAEVQQEAESWIGYAGLRHVIYAKAMVRDGKFTAEQFAAATSPHALTASIGYPEMHVSAVELVFRTRRK